EEHLADQLVDLLHLAARLLDQRERVGVRERGRLEERQQARERRAQLVRDRGSEAGAELLVGGEIAGRAQVEERLATAVHLVEDGERRCPPLDPDELRRQRPALLEPLERLACAAARADDALLLVQDDHDLATLLDQHATALGLDAQLVAPAHVHELFTRSSPAVRPRGTRRSLSWPRDAQGAHRRGRRGYRP